MADWRPYLKGAYKLPYLRAKPECGIKSLAEYIAAKERVKLAELDRAIMARAAHLKVTR